MNLMRSLCRTAAMAALTTALLTGPSQAVPGDDFHGYPDEVTLIVHKPAAHRYELLTPIACYEHPETGRQVDLIGMIHLAQPDYFRRINRLLGQYDKILFEMVGGEDIPELVRLLREPITTEKDLERVNEITEKLMQNQHLISRINGWFQMRVAQRAGLSDQSSLIDYGRANMVFADMTNAQYDAAMNREPNAFFKSFKELFWTPGMPLEDQFLTGYQLLFGDQPAALYSLLAACSYPAGDEDEDSVIIAQRNAVCISVLDRETADPQVKRVAVLYGALHLPGIDHMLRQRGYRLRAVRWMRALESPEPRTPAAPASAASAEAPAAAGGAATASSPDAAGAPAPAEAKPAEPAAPAPKSPAHESPAPAVEPTTPAPAAVPSPEPR